MNILWQGARGPVVKGLQTKLKELGYNPGDIDGIFGPATAAAVTAFQKNQKLIPDGIVGPRTFHTLKLPTHPLVVKAPARTKVFVSYSHEDEKWLKMFQVHIAPLERTGIVDRWDDTKITPGKKWREEIAIAIQSSKVAILLISAYFMASEYIAENELPPLLEAAEHDGAVILPVIISPCVMGSLADYQAVNSPSKPLVDLSRGDRDRVWVKLVEAVTAALND